MAPPPVIKQVVALVQYDPDLNHNWVIQELTQDLKIKIYKERRLITCSC